MLFHARRVQPKLRRGFQVPFYFGIAGARLNDDLILVELLHRLGDAESGIDGDLLCAERWLGDCGDVKGYVKSADGRALA